MVALLLPIFGGQKVDFSASAESEIEREVKELAESVNGAENFEQMYSSLAVGQQITVYNFLAVVRFSGESELMDKNFPSLNSTYYEVLEKMYNGTNTYSVNQYYKEVSNNRLNLQTVFVFGEDSYQTSKPRSTYINKNYNGGTGYDPSYKIPFVGIEQRVYLEYTLYDEICSQVMPFVSGDTYKMFADSNGDDYVDSLSIVMLPDPNGYVVKWQDLLWAHSSTVPLSYLTSYGSFVNKDNFVYSYVQGGKTYTKYLLKYMLTELDSELNSATNLPKNNTDIHELGHVLGWPDYYVYDSAYSNTDVDSNVEPVYVWDIMAYNHLDLPQYPLSYNRYKQGWLDEGNIVQIKKNGNYTIKPVSYEKIAGTSLGTRTVAYKITNPEYPNQAIWLEYRKQQSGTFDNNPSYLRDGLLVYRVDEGFEPVSDRGESLSAGNYAAAPYNVYVFRNEMQGKTTAYQVQNAPLNTSNKIMGDGGIYNVNNIRTTSCDITWQSYFGTVQNNIPASSVSYVSSGIVIEVISINNATNELTFSVDWEGFNVEIKQSDFDDVNLYNKLLSLAGKTTGDKLFQDDLKDIENLDLSNLNLSSVKGLELMTFESLQEINLLNNQLSNIDPLVYISQTNPNVKFNLINNKISLSSISSSLLINRNFVFLVQRLNYEDGMVLFNQSFNFDYNYKATDGFDFKLNGQTISYSQANTLQETLPGEYCFEIYKNEELIFSKKIHIVKLSLKNENVSIERNSVDDIQLKVEGMSQGEFEITKTPSSIDTTVVANSILVKFNVVYKKNTNFFKNLTFTVQVVDTTAPQVEVLGLSKIELLVGQELTLPQNEISISDNGDLNLPYQFVSNLSGQNKNVWTKKIYLADFVENQGYQKGQLVSQIDNTKIGTYIIEYQAIDGQGNIGYGQRVVIFSSKKLSREEIADDNLYDAIAKLAGTQDVYETSVIQMDFVNLSGQEIENVLGLRKFVFKSGAIIDLSNNNISSEQEVLNLISEQNISKVNLIGNKIVSASLNSKLIFGYQGEKHAFYDAKNYQSVEYVIFDDFTSWFSVSGNLDKFGRGQKSLSTLGVYEFNLKSLSNFSDFSYKFVYAKIDQYKSQEKLEVFSNLDLDSFFDVQGFLPVYKCYVQGEFKTEEELVSQIWFTSVDVKIFESDFEVTSLSIMLTVQDTTAPTISIGGNSIIYAKKGEVPELEPCVALDNYDQNPQITTYGSVDFNKSGQYIVSYMAQDSSGNISDIVSRTIYVGDVRFADIDFVEYNSSNNMYNILIFEFYQISDFVITGFKDFDTTKLGKQNIFINLQYTRDQSIEFNLTKDIVVKDSIRPQITLYGKQEVFIYIDSVYQDAGSRGVDNHDGDISHEVTLDLSKLKTDEIGRYEIAFNLKDQSGNYAQTVYRYVNVICKPILDIEVKMSTSKFEYTLADKINFEVELPSYDKNKNEDAPTFVWRVDGVEVYRGTNLAYSHQFDQIGSHTVTASVLNTNLDGNLVETQSQAFFVQISDYSFFDKYGGIVIGASVGFMVLVFIIAFNSRRKRKLF